MKRKLNAAIIPKGTAQFDSTLSTGRRKSTVVVQFPDPASRGELKRSTFDSSPRRRATRLCEVGFLRLPQVLEIIPVSKSTWWNGIRAGKFPKPVKLTERTSAWRRKDVEALCARLSGTDGSEASRNPQDQGSALL